MLMFVLHLVLLSGRHITALCYDIKDSETTVKAS